MVPEDGSQAARPMSTPGQAAFEEHYRGVEPTPRWGKLSEKQQARWERTAGAIAAAGGAHATDAARRRAYDLEADIDRLEKEFAAKERGITLELAEARRSLATARRDAKRESDRAIAEVRRTAGRTKREFDEAVERRLGEVLEERAAQLAAGALPERTTVLCSFGGGCYAPTEWDVHRDGDALTDRAQVCAAHLHAKLAMRPGSYRVTTINLSRRRSS